MATRPAVQTNNVARSKLAEVFKNHEVLKAFENLTNDVSTVLPDASASNNAAIQAATDAGNQAQTAAAAAQGAADAAQADADAAQAQIVTLMAQIQSLTKRIAALEQGIIS